jgi:hypothetical protein
MPVSGRSLLAAGYGLSLVAACGARSALREPPAVPPPAECRVDADCPGHDDKCEPIICVDSDKYKDKLPPLPEGTLLPPRVCFADTKTSCDDGDACTLDTCDPPTGECQHAPATPDLDGDMHSAPLPGHKAGDMGSCGDDCDDADPTVHPGATDTCAKDKNCDGNIPPGIYQPLGGDVRISTDNVAPAGPGGLAFAKTSYLAVYSGGADGTQTYEQLLDPNGMKIPPIEQRITLHNGDTGGGPTVWIGDRYGLAWADRRDGDYEIYFGQLGPDGKKVLADTRITNAGGFSINPSMIYHGGEFLLAWEDDRGGGEFQVFAQRIGLDGKPKGGNVVLSDPDLDGLDDESPNMAAGIKTIGLVYSTGVAGNLAVQFKSFAQGTLAPQVGPVMVSAPGVSSVVPQIAWAKDRYVIAWVLDSGTQRPLFATAVDEQGKVLVPVTAITSPPPGKRSRYPQLLSLGDRLVVVYGDNRDGNGGYELYTRTISNGLAPLSGEMRVTNAVFDSTWSVAAFGPTGEAGILFRDHRTGIDQVYFTRLGCVVTPK